MGPSNPRIARPLIVLKEDKMWLNTIRTYANECLCHRLWRGPAISDGEVLRSLPAVGRQSRIHEAQE